MERQVSNNPPAERHALDGLLATLPYLKLTTNFSAQPAMIPTQSVMSVDELVRRGITKDRSTQLMGNGVQTATAEEIAHAKHVVGLTPELEAERTREVENLVDSLARPLREAGRSPAKIAESLYVAMTQWHVLETNFVNRSDGITFSNVHMTPTPWVDTTRVGFEQDFEREKMRAYSRHFDTCIDMLMPSILDKLPNLDIEPLQRFARSARSPSIQSNPHYGDAELVAQNLPRRFAVVTKVKPLYLRAWAILTFLVAPIAFLGWGTHLGDLLWTKMFPPKP